MNTKSFRFFVIFILIIFLAAVAYFVFGIFHTISANSTILHDRYSVLTSKIISLADETSPFSVPFSNQLEADLSENPYISCITLSDSNSAFFAWPADSSHFVINQSGNPEISVSTPTLKTFSDIIHTSYGDITVTAALNTILKSEFYTVCSRTFIIVLAGTVFDFLLLIYLALFTQSSAKEMNKTLEDIEEEINTIAGKSEPKETAQPKAAEPKPAEEKKTVEKEDDEQTDSSDPAGLFSEKSGFGWESYLEPRLDAELIRAASNEMDLSLFIINIQDIDKDSPVFNAVCETMLEFFQYKDMVFEYGESGFAGILVNTNIDGAMAASELLYTNLKDIFNEYECNASCGIGLTTRSLRLITGARLLNEAKKAAEKAMGEKTLPIVAFRVNHEKSKQYLAESAERFVG
ncbi:MAG: hypothetical protein J5647_11125 [Spirochaetaceae bacterium]|nr:hypothetical protein [Spirochaetaceae bacterium]